MSEIVCPICGGVIEEMIHDDGIHCETCGFIIKSNGSEDYSEIE